MKSARWLCLFYCLLCAPASADWDWWISLQAVVSDSERNRCSGPCEGIRIRQTENLALSGGVYYTGWRLEPGISAETDYGRGGLLRVRWREGPFALALGYGVHEVRARASYRGPDQGSGTETVTPHFLAQFDFWWFTLRYGRVSPSHRFEFREALGEDEGLGPAQRVRVDSRIESWWLGFRMHL